MADPVECTELGGICEYEVDDCPLFQFPETCMRLVEPGGDDPETPPPGGPG